MGVDCVEYPCLLLVAGRVPSGQSVDWKARLDDIRADVGADHQVLHRRYDDTVDGWQYSFAAHAVLPSDDPITGTDVRLQYRMGEAMLEHWPEWMPQR